MNALTDDRRSLQLSIVDNYAKLMKRYSAHFQLLTALIIFYVHTVIDLAVGISWCSSNRALKLSHVNYEH